MRLSDKIGDISGVRRQEALCEKHRRAGHVAINKGIGEILCQTTLRTNF